MPPSLSLPVGAALSGCAQAYWPFHREFCRKNDFADMIEKDEPKFARWMRKHGKQAVLKDGEEGLWPVRIRSVPRRNLACFVDLSRLQSS